MKNIKELVHDLELVELQTTDDVPSQIYSRLLALYLFENELCYAKYLWKRIPCSIKNNNTDLNSIWAVAQKMWQRDWSAVHTALNVEWNKNVEDIMIALKDRIRERALLLIGDAYSSLDLSTLAKMIGLSLEESSQAASGKGWNIVGSVVKPRKFCKIQYSSVDISLTEDQLYKLTQFVSFLEN